MFSFSTETAVGWATALLVAGAVLALAGGLWQLRRVRRLPYFRLRREVLSRGWQLLFLGAVLLISGGVMRGLGVRAVAAVNPPTVTPTPSPTPSRTPQPSATFTHTSPPTLTQPPTATLTASPTASLTPSPLPQLPLAYLTPPGPSRVTPPAAANVSDLHLALKENCAAPEQTALDQLPKTLYAHFTPAQWAPGMAWTVVWMRNGGVIFVESQLWSGESAGCLTSAFNNNTYWWPEGNYVIQVFAGERWLTSSTFAVLRLPPSPTP